MAPTEYLADIKTELVTNDLVASFLTFRIMFTSQTVGLNREKVLASWTCWSDWPVKYPERPGGSIASHSDKGGWQWIYRTDLRILLHLGRSNEMVPGEELLR